MQNVFLARSLRSGNSKLWSRCATRECRYTLLPQALLSIGFLAHTTFTCIGSTFRYPHKRISRAPHAPRRYKYGQSFGAPTLPVHGSIDAKNELGINGKSWLGLCNRLHIVVSRPVWKLPVTMTSQNWRRDLCILEIINYRRVKNLVVSSEAIPSEILFTIEQSNCFITTLQIAVMYSRFVATSEIKCKN